MKRSVGTLRVRVALVAATVAVTTAVVSFPLTIVYFERRLDGLDPDVQREVDTVFTSNVPADFDGLSELATALMLAVALGVLAGILVARRPARTIAAVATAAQRIASGDLDARAGTGARRFDDDISDLANNFDAMADTLERLEAERTATSASIAHELRNPLAIIQARLTALRDGVLPTSDAEYSRLLGHTDTLERVIEDLRTLSLWHAGQLRLSTAPVNLAQLVIELGVSLDVPTAVPAEPVVLDIDEHRLRQAIVNLVINARRHAAAAAVTILLTVDGADTYLDVLDDGPGIDPNLIAAATNRFTTFGVTSGSGLGLTIVRAVATAHDGTLELTNLHPNGLRARLTLNATSSTDV
jgi:two-component system, OmpR family, sensor histidine kinase BaeS